MATVADERIVVDDAGVARIAGTRFRVHQVVNRFRGHLSADQLRRQHPSLSREQIDAAFAYYAEHATRIDAEAGEASRRAATQGVFEAEELRAAEEAAVNERAFDVNRAAIRSHYAGRYVGFAFGRVIAADADAEAVRAVLDALDPQPRSQAVFRAEDEPAFAHYWDTYSEYR